ncbi:MAG: PIG-L family deacetylase [Ardenticatenaceae bacterium]|nr:PIG-L family deacetylase [Ardenticatenaceae bacterium]HBY96674.1 GlcNAc-PI de-N-acetylase [Chloroflexota bacterium]
MAGLMIVLAHPDDEVLGTAGSMAKAADSGRSVQLVCATRGEEGEIHKPGVSRDELAATREAELRCSADALGVDEVVFLGYRDSGMAGEPTNEHPHALAQAPREQVAERIVEMIRTFQPDVVVTFGPEGGYGHPDHIAIHHATTLAFTDAGDAYRFPVAGEPWQPVKLYFVALASSFFRLAADLLRAEDLPPVSFTGEPFEELGRPEHEITTIVDVSEFVEQKQRALACHETQLGPEMVFARLSPEAQRRLLSRETFVRAHPLVPAGFRETDLFEGLEEPGG